MSSSFLSLLVIFLLVLNYAEGVSCASEQDTVAFGLCSNVDCDHCRDKAHVAIFCAHTCCTNCKSSSCNSCKAGSECGTSTGWGDRKWCYLADGMMAKYCDGAEKSELGDYFYGSSACDNCHPRTGYKVSVNKACVGRNELGHTQKSLEDCAAACDADDRCVSFERSSNDNKNDCWLSSSCKEADLTDYDGYCNYEKNCVPLVKPFGKDGRTKFVLHADKACNGQNELTKPAHHGIMTVEECAQFCADEPTCVSFEYKNDGQQCYRSTTCNEDHMVDYANFCLYVRATAPCDVGVNWLSVECGEQSIEVEVAAENDRLKEVNRALKKTLKDLES